MPSTAPEVSVSTVAATATSTGHHMLKIEGFEFEHLKAIHGNGSYFEACRFQAAGHAWKIRFHPNGYCAADPGYIALFLMRDDDGDDENKEEEESAGAGVVVHAEVRFALVYPRCDAEVLMRDDAGVTVKGLENSGFLKDDCLAVRCDITVVERSAVKEEVVKAADMARMGMLCKCNDDLCKRRHHRA